MAEESRATQDAGEIRVPLAALGADPANPRSMTEAARAGLGVSMETFGELGMVFNDRSGQWVSGHQRYERLCSAGASECMRTGVEGYIEHPKTRERFRVRFVDWDEAKQRMANLVANNPHIGGDFTEDALAQLKELEGTDGFEDMGLDALEKDIEKELARTEEKTDENRLIHGEDLDESKVLALKEDVRFDGAGPWDLPALRADRILASDCYPTLFRPMGERKNEGLQLWNYGSDSTVGLDWRRCVVGFYVDDSRFECLWKDTAGHITPMVNRKVAGLIAPNYSCYYEFPSALSLWNVFRSRWVARYAQEAGLSVMPDISGAPQDVGWIFDGIPNGSPVAIQFHRETEKTIKEKDAVIAACVKSICPPVIWCYGQEKKEAWYPSLKSQNCRWIVPRSEMRRKEGYNNG